MPGSRGAPLLGILLASAIQALVVIGSYKLHASGFTWGNPFSCLPLLVITPGALLLDYLALRSRFHLSSYGAFFPALFLWGSTLVFSVFLALNLYGT